MKGLFSAILIMFSPNSDSYPEHNAHSLWPTRAFTLTAPLGKSPERWKLTHIDPTELAYNGI